MRRANLERLAAREYTVMLEAVERMLGQTPTDAWNDEHLARCLQAWLRYEVDCESFDRTLPGRMECGVWRVRSDLIVASMANASKARRRTDSALLYADQQASKMARREASKYNYEKQVRCLQDLDERFPPSPDVIPVYNPPRSPKARPPQR